MDNKKQIKKTVIILLVFFLLIIIIPFIILYGFTIFFIDLLSIFSSPLDNLSETEYFQYYVSDYFNSCTIVGLTEEGCLLEEVVIPKKINGIRVDALGHINTFNNEEKSQMKKLFIPNGISFSREDIFKNCSHLTSVIFISYRPHFEDPGFDCLSGNRYAPSEFLDNYRKKGYDTILPANVSYMNNYSDEINGGYYWIDDIEDGEKIVTIPEEPIREGYDFDGWFKEEECINKWDFTSDVKGSEDIILYAKWIN